MRQSPPPSPALSPSFPFLFLSSSPVRCVTAPKCRFPRAVDVDPYPIPLPLVIYSLFQVRVRVCVRVRPGPGHVESAVCLSPTRTGDAGVEPAGKCREIQRQRRRPVRKSGAETETRVRRQVRAGPGRRGGSLRSKNRHTPRPRRTPTRLTSAVHCSTATRGYVHVCKGAAPGLEPWTATVDCDTTVIGSVLGTRTPERGTRRAEEAATERYD